MPWRSGGIFWRCRRPGVACVRRENFFEREFTLVARARIAALGKINKRPGDSGDLAAYRGVLSAPAYAAAGVRNT